MDDLVERLQNDQPVEVTIRPERTVERLKECLDRAYVHVKFTQTTGGTELGVRIDPAASDFTQADFERGTGSIRIVGDLKLNYVPVRCVAEIDVATFQGSGRLDVTGEDARANNGQSPEPST